MKNYDFNELNKFGVVELTQDEQNEIAGGWFWIVLALASGLAAAVLTLIDALD
jgi:hypothetical protein